MLLQVITGTTRQGRFSERVAAWVLDRLQDHGGFDVEAIDLRDHPLPFFAAEMAPAHASGVYEDDEVARFGATVAPPTASSSSPVSTTTATRPC